MMMLRLPKFKSIAYIFGGTTVVIQQGASCALQYKNLGEGLSLQHCVHGYKNKTNKCKSRP